MRILIEREHGEDTELGWYCDDCGAFNGNGKEKLLKCRCCQEPRSRNALERFDRDAL